MKFGNRLISSVTALLAAFSQMGAAVSADYDAADNGNGGLYGDYGYYEESDGAATEEESSETAGAGDEEIIGSLDEKLFLSSDDEETVSLTPGEWEYLERVNEEFFAMQDDPLLTAAERDAGYDFSSDYYYNQLTTADQRNVYNDMKEVCEEFYNSSGDLEYNVLTSKTYISNTGTANYLAELFQAFYLSNPQYFFIYGGEAGKNAVPKVGLSAGYDNGGAYVGIGIPVYSDLRNGTERIKYRNTIQTVTDQWLAEMNKEPLDLDKEKYLYNKLRNTVSYSEAKHNQTIAGALADKKCVCNGYALAAEYFLNAAGIDCAVIRGQNHAWNAVKLYGVWYELDVTWYDTTGGDEYWLNRSHEAILAQDDGSHIYNSGMYGSGLLSPPSCTSDTVKSVTVDVAFVHPAKLDYYAGDELDMTGAAFVLNYSDGTSEAVNITDDMVKGYDSMNEGRQTLKITYGGRTYTFDVTVTVDPEHALLSLTGSGLNGDIPFIDINKAFERMSENSSGEYTLTLKKNITARSLNFPANTGGRVTINGNGYSLTVVGNMNLAPKCDLVLNDVYLRAVKSTDDSTPMAVTINAAKDLSLYDSLFINAKTVKLKGSKSSALNLTGHYTNIDSVTGFASVRLSGAFTSGKKFTVAELRLITADTVFAVPANSTVKITDLYGGSNTYIDLSAAGTKGFKPLAAANAHSLDNSGRISLINAKKGVQVFNSKTLSLSAFDLSKCAAAEGSSNEYALTRKGAKISVGEAVLQLSGINSENYSLEEIGKFVFFSDAAAVIEENGDRTKGYLIQLLGDYDNGGALKFPKEGTYSVININGYSGSDDVTEEFRFTGGLKPTGYLVFNDIKVRSVKSKTDIPVKYSVKSKYRVSLNNADLGSASVTADSLWLSRKNVVLGNISVSDAAVTQAGTELTMLYGADIKVTKNGLTVYSGSLAISYADSSGMPVDVQPGYIVSGKFVGNNYEYILVNGKPVVYDNGKLKAA